MPSKRKVEIFLVKFHESPAKQFLEVAYNEIKLENIIKNRNFAEIFTNQ